MNALAPPIKQNSFTSSSNSSSWLVQRKCGCGGSSKLGAQCSECQKKKLVGMQPKLRIGAANDVYEQEADRVAEQVMAMSTNSNIGKTPLSFQRYTGQSNGQADNAPASVERVLASTGRPLDSALQQDMGNRFGHEFSQVRVHTGSAAEQSARDVNAHAYAVGQNIVFGPGQFAPWTHGGRRLLAHELTHVVQQNRDKIRRNEVTTEEFDLEQQKDDYHDLVDRWHSRYQNNLQTNARLAGNANQRFIDFEEGGISQLKTTGSLGGSVIALFGGPAAVVGLCVGVLTEVAAQQLSSKQAKIAAAVTNLAGKFQEAQRVLDSRRDNLDARIDGMTSAFDHSGWSEISNLLANYGTPAVVDENIIYRDLLLELARGGGYNISGSQWNVDNMSIFGDADWYHSWDWGSPGWTNGRDIAAELNSLAQGDPSTRTKVSINPP